MVVLDDPLRGREEASSPTIRQQVREWYGSVVFTRLQPGAANVIVSTRWSLDDLSSVRGGPNFR